MEIYKNLSGNSGITHYEIGEDYIDVKFIDNPTIYFYCNKKISKAHINKMKDLAKKGKGLCTYIAQNPEIKDNFSKR
ncbi:MAG: hypothetical protein M0R21_09375 [Lentimicrobiaceae bacterium]|jgi:hypothetical protein|nr:hypothetical protein [Lentimicrobiaceae bacterium]